MEKVFTCIDCRQQHRKGMEVETDWYLGAEDQGGSRCVFCYNKRTMHPVDPEWYVSVANRLEHEEDIIEAAELYITNNAFHTYSTNAEYELVIQFRNDWSSKIEAIRIREKLVKEGFICSEERKGSFTVNFSGKYERHFRR